MENQIDCRSEEGITISLIDALITQCRILRHRNLDSSNVKEALKDLQADNDLKYLLNNGK